MDAKSYQVEVRLSGASKPLRTFRPFESRDAAERFASAERTKESGRGFIFQVQPDAGDTTEAVKSLIELDLESDGIES